MSLRLPLKLYLFNLVPGFERSREPWHGRRLRCFLRTCSVNCRCLRVWTRQMWNLGIIIHREIATGRWTGYIIFATISDFSWWTQTMGINLRVILGMFQFVSLARIPTHCAKTPVRTSCFNNHYPIMLKLSSFYVSKHMILLCKKTVRLTHTTLIMQ